MQRGPDQLARKTDMAFRVVREAEVGAAGILGWIVDATVGIDLQHERRPVAVDPEIATAKARALERDEEARRNMAQSGVERRIADRESRHRLVIHPLQVRMLEGLAVGKAILNRSIGLRTRRI